METYALLIASTLNAGTVLALAALGLLINEKSGIVNLGAEGMKPRRREFRRRCHGKRRFMHRLRLY